MNFLLLLPINSVVNIKSKTFFKFNNLNITTEFNLLSPTKINSTLISLYPILYKKSVIEAVALLELQICC